MGETDDTQLLSILATITCTRALPQIVHTSVVENIIYGQKERGMAY